MPSCAATLRFKFCCRLWLDFSDVGSIVTPLTLLSIQVQNTYSFSNNVTQTRGKHSLRFGAEVRREEYTILQPLLDRARVIAKEVADQIPSQSKLFKPTK